MNNCIFMGRIAKELELKTSKTGMAILKFPLAVSRMKKDEPADFLSMIAFGKTAETIVTYLRKGDQILLNTHVQTGSYENKEGIKVYTTDFIIDRFEFVGGGNKGNNAGAENLKQLLKDNDELVAEEYDADEIPF